MEHILITGANGFLGSSLVRFFLNKGHKICAVSRNSNNLDHILQDITFLKYTGSYITLSEQIKEFCPSIVIHCAWSGGNSNTNVNKHLQIHDNISSGLILLDILISMDINVKFIGVGSFAEYGNTDGSASELDPNNPTSLYGLAKSTFKNISQMVCLQNNIEWLWIRPCVVYGIGDVQTRLIPSTIRSLLNEQSIKLNSCNIMIDYLHIDDFCTAVDTIISKNGAGIFNISYGEGMNLQNDVIKKIQNIINNDVNIDFDKSLDKPNSPKYVCENNKKLKDLGWSPLVEFDSGIKSLINFYKYPVST